MDPGVFCLSYLTTPPVDHVNTVHHAVASSYDADRHSNIRDKHEGRTGQRDLGTGLPSSPEPSLLLRRPSRRWQEWGRSGG